MAANVVGSRLYSIGIERVEAKDLLIGNLNMELDFELHICDYAGPISQFFFTSQR